MSDTYASVWDALTDNPAEAELLKTKSELMTAIRGHITAHAWTQTEAAKHFGVTQPRVSDLNRGKLSKFSLDALVSMAAAAGLHTEIRLLETA